MKILAIGAHPDDIEAFMFGTLAACRARGDDIVFAIATDGAKGAADPSSDLASIRESEARASAAMLEGQIHFLGFPDGNLAGSSGVNEALSDLIAKTGPAFIITHAANDYHGDHRTLSSAVDLAASFRAPVLYCDPIAGTGFTPTTYVDISAHIEAKCAALRCHVSQDPERYIDGVRNQAGFRAAQCNAVPGSHAEAFRFEPRFPFADIRDLLPPAPPVSSIAGRAETKK